MPSKQINFVILLLFANYWAFGQNPKIELGIEFGPNLYMSSNPYPTYNFVSDQKIPALGINVTPTFQYNFHRIFSFRMGLGYQSFSEKLLHLNTYSPEGQSMPSIGQSSYYDTYHTAHIPTQIRATFGKSTRFFINAGTHLSLLTKRSRYTSFVASSENPLYVSSEEHQNKNAFDIQLGAVMGMGISVPVGQKINFSIEARTTSTLLKHSTLSRLFSQFRHKPDITPTLLFSVTYKL